MNEKAVVIPEPNCTYKVRVSTGMGGVTTECEVVRLSEYRMLAIRFAALQAEVDALKGEVARLSAPVTDAEWDSIWHSTARDFADKLILARATPPQDVEPEETALEGLTRRMNKQTRNIGI